MSSLAACKADSSCLRLPLRVAIEFLAARVSQLSSHMIEYGLQPPAMPPGNGLALQKVFTSLGLRDILRDLSANIADTSRTTGRSGLATQTAGSGDMLAQASPIAIPVALTEVATHEQIPQEEHYNYDDFGNELQLWNSHAETEISNNTPGHKGPSPYTLDISPFEEVFGGSTEAMSAGRSQVNYEGPSIFDEEDAAQSNGSNESLVDELSHRVGTLTIGPSGRTKLHGASLMFDVEKATNSTFPSGNLEFLASSQSLSTHGIGGSGSDVPEELQEHLVNQYFDWENPFSDIMDREIYTLAKARCKNGEASPYFSQALCNAM